MGAGRWCASPREIWDRDRVTQLAAAGRGEFFSGRSSKLLVGLWTQLWTLILALRAGDNVQLLYSGSGRAWRESAGLWIPYYSSAL